MNDKEEQLDRLLTGLADTYARQQVPAGAIDRIKRRLRAETNTLSDADLDWLAAAGDRMPTDSGGPEDE
ncbi:hypothetical protein [Noviherbaspirillum suwonense]|uniref:Uncharacterized protein n=1 Tax=Noviherbaspirillum suwonense TaxID=1224511 RepID=A0ABY1Q3K5_9BURK|nr:hypothetical protein [Noviherbaspirillum suwonense]SMP55499.1 hypothetical protein SAMN06295970_104182 [Noviherbaspirillum suwonense]